MKDKDFRKMREVFISEQERNRLLRDSLSNEKVRNVFENGNIKPPKVLDDMGIIDDLIDRFKFNYSPDITYTLGLFYVTDEDNYFEEHRLINKKIAEELEEIMKTRFENEFVTYELYDPFSGLVSYSKEPKGLILPSQEEAVNSIDTYDKSRELKKLYNRKLSIARRQMFLMLMKTRYEDVVSYYNNQNNFARIESNIDSYIKKLERGEQNER